MKFTGENADVLTQMELDAEERYIRDLATEIKIQQSEIDKIELRMNESIKKHDEHLENIKNILNDPENDKFKTKDFSYWWKKTETVVISDKDQIPMKFINSVTKTTHNPDKNVIKKAIQSGEDVPGTGIKNNYSFQRQTIKAK